MQQRVPRCDVLCLLLRIQIPCWSKNLLTCCSRKVAVKRIDFSVENCHEIVKCTFLVSDTSFIVFAAIFFCDFITFSCNLFNTALYFLCFWSGGWTYASSWRNISVNLESNLKRF